MSGERNLDWACEALPAEWRGYSGAHVKHRLARCLRDMGVSLTVEDASFIPTGIMDNVVPVGSLADATRPEFRDKELLIDLTFPYPHSIDHLRRGQPSGSACIDRVAAGHAEAATRRTCAHPERPVFDARS